MVLGKLKITGIIFLVMGILVAGILYSIYLNPNDVVYYNTFQNAEFEAVGDYHLERVSNNEKHWAIISNVTLINDETILIIFQRNSYRIGNETFTQYEVPNKFEYTNFVKKDQTFIPVCMGKSSPVFLKYMGIVQISGNYYYQFFHTNANLPQGLICKYPEIIQHSFVVNFNMDDDSFHSKRFLLNGTLYKDSSMMINVAHPCNVLDCKFP